MASGINDKNAQGIEGINYWKNFYDSAPQGKEGDAKRAYAANQADYIRKFFKMRGIDLGEWGGNNLSTEQSNLAWGNYVLNEAEKYQNKFQAVQDNLKNNYGENSNDHFWRLYDEYRQQGYGDRQAAILAGRETRTYQQERVGNLRDAINEYGIDNGNSLNQFGVNTLAQIAEEDNIMGTAIAQGFATPKENYEKQQAMLQEMLRQTSANQRKQAEILANQFLTEYVQGQTNLRNTQTNQTKLDVAEINQGGQDARQKALFKHQWDLKKADQEFQIFMKEFEAALKGEKQNGTGQSGKANKEDYDKLRNMRSRYEKIYNDAAGAGDTQSANEIKAKMDYIDKLLDYKEDPRYQYDWGDDNEANARSYLAAEKQGVTSEELKQWVQQHIPNKQAQHRFYDLVENIRKRWF